MAYNNPDDPYRTNLTDSDIRRQARLEGELQADPELAEGPASGGKVAMFAVAIAVVLGAVFLWHAWKLMDPPDEFYAMRVFNYSIVYLMALFAFLLVDHWLLPWLQPAPALVFQPG